MVCPLCDGPAAFILKVEAGGALQARRLGGGSGVADAGGGGGEACTSGGGEAGAQQCAPTGKALLELGHDAWLGRLPETHQDALTDAVARCAAEAERAALVRVQMCAPCAANRAASAPFSANEWRARTGVARSLELSSK